MDKRQEILKTLSCNLREVLSQCDIDFSYLQEVRLRINQPLMVVYDNHSFFITKDGKLRETPEDAFIVNQAELRETMEYISNYSIYAYEEEIRQGYITIQGGHRVGVAGKAVMDGQQIRNLKYISFLNIRLAHEVKGCATKLMQYIHSKGQLCDTLIISPPGAGKTTLLRDLIRQLSNGALSGHSYTVGVVDERSEIGACYLGVPQNDLGIQTDILDCCPKAKGMMMLIRSMTPQVLAVDEIGSKEDLEAIKYAITCGCHLIATVHGENIDEIRNKPLLGKFVREKLFQRYIILDGQKKAGTIKSIYDERGSLISGGGCVC